MYKGIWAGYEDKARPLTKTNVTRGVVGSPSLSASSLAHSLPVVGLCKMSEMNSQKQGEEGGVVVADLMAQVAKAADDLYNIRDTYFPLNPDDKISKLQRHSDLALKLLDSIPPGTSAP